VPTTPANTPSSVPPSPPFSYQILIPGLTKSAALEHGEAGIRVNAVCPGFTDTKLLNSLSNEGEHLGAMAKSVPMKRLARPEEIGELAAFLLSDRASFISGSVHVCDGAHTATGSGCVN
jgi:NAD(P)-dependent dehydrogenase (short-subunit alcohol dehydrogenase family)